MFCKFSITFRLILISFQLSVKMCERASKGCVETDCLLFTRLLVKGFGGTEVIERGIHLIKIASHVLFKQVGKYIESTIHYFNAQYFFLCVCVYSNVPGLGLFIECSHREILCLAELKDL